MTEQLKELGKWKVGHKAVLQQFLGTESIQTITRITNGRGGTIYVSISKNSDVAFDINGTERGGANWHPRTIQPATDEDIKQIRCNYIKFLLKQYDWSKLTEEQTINFFEYLNKSEISIKFTSPHNSLTSTE